MAEAPPGLADDATITLNEAHSNDVAVAVSAGSQGRDVQFKGMNTSGRKVAFLGDTTFSTLNYATTRETLSIAAEATLTITGGAMAADGKAVKKSFSTPESFNIYAILKYDGAIRFTGAEVVLHPLNAVNGKIYIDNPEAKVSFNKGTVTLGGELHVLDSQQMLGFNESVGIFATRAVGGSLVSRSGHALTNWYACNVQAGLLEDSSTLFNLAGGTYQSLKAHNWTASGGGATRHAHCDFTGDVTLVGTNENGHALYVSRRSTSASYYAGVRLNGYGLTILNGGLMQLGDAEDDESTWNGRIEADGATVTTDGTIACGPGGYLVGDANTVVSLAEHWDNRSQWRAANFKLEQSTVKLTGSATRRAPQLFEVQSEDLGESAAGMVNNHAIGRVEIGTAAQATFVRLVDESDFKEDAEADVLYLGELYVAEGSVLDLRGLEVYVGGESVRGRQGAFGPGQIINSARESTVMMVR